MRKWGFWFWFVAVLTAVSSAVCMTSWWGGNLTAGLVLWTWVGIGLLVWSLTRRR